MSDGGNVQVISISHKKVWDIVLWEGEGKMKTEYRVKIREHESLVYILLSWGYSIYFYTFKQNISRQFK